jgi:hypothetical protein
MKSAWIRGLSVVGVTIAAGATSAGAAPAPGSLPDTTYLALEGVGMGYPLAVTSTQTATQLDVKVVLRGADMAEPFYSGWVAPTLQGKNVLKSGELVVETGGPSRLPVSTTQFTSVKPRLIEFSEFELGVTAPRFEVTFSATNFKIVTTKSATSAPAPARNLRLDTRLLIDGIDCTRVTKIGAISATMSAPTAGARGAATVSVSNLGVVMRADAVAGFQQWLDSGAIPKSGAIEYRSTPSVKWATLSLKGLAVTKITSIDSALSRVEMSVGGLAFAVAP